MGVVKQFLWPSRYKFYDMQKRKLIKQLQLRRSKVIYIDMYIFFDDVVSTNQNSRDSDSGVEVDEVESTLRSQAPGIFADYESAVSGKSQFQRYRMFSKNPFINPSPVQLSIGSWAGLCGTLKSGPESGTRNYGKISPVRNTESETNSELSKTIKIMRKLNQLSIFSSLW